MKIVIYILLGIVFVAFVVLIVGLCLPKKRILTKQTIYNASIEKVYSTVTNNSDWKYRTSLDDLRIVKINGDFEIWEETSAGNTMRFETKEKRPFTFYSFEMDCNFFSGEWFAEFESVETNKTRFTATESIEYKNPFIRVFGYAFIDIGKYMEIYQNELREKLEIINSRTHNKVLLKAGLNGFD